MMRIPPTVVLALISVLCWSDQPASSVVALPDRCLAGTGLKRDVSCEGRYVVGIPEKPYVSVRLPNGKTLGVNAAGLSSENRFVRSVTFNGWPVANLRLSKSEIMNGGELNFEMSARYVICERNSFGPLSPSSRPQSREYIWPDGMPNVRTNQIAAKTSEMNEPGFDPENYRRPYIDWYMPEPSNRIDVCVITVSGGGFRVTCDEARLQPVIDRLVRAGITVADLTYRTPRPDGLPIYQSAWEDLQRTVRIVRSQASVRGYSTYKIGATGISAGAKAVLLIATSSETRAYPRKDSIDDIPCNLDFAIPQASAYVLTDGAGGQNARDGDSPEVEIVPELKFDAKTCPMCLFHGGKDVLSPLGATRVYRELRLMGIPAELHLFADRWHGFHGDLNRRDDGTAWDHWFDRALEFLRQMNIDGRLGAEVPIRSRFATDSNCVSDVTAPVWPTEKIPDPNARQCTPHLEWHVPKVLNTKSIQIVCSGCAYNDNRPEEWGGVPAVRRYLNAKGMSVVIFQYRTPRPVGLAKHVSAWQDLQRTIRIVRHEAPLRGLDPGRIGIMGSSAGGHLSLMGATSSLRRSYLSIDNVDKLPCNVQWAIVCDPAYVLTDGLDGCNDEGGNGDSVRLAPEFSFDLMTCPMLLIHGDADDYSSMGSVKVWEQMRRMGVQCDLHTLARRGHGFMLNASPGTGSYTWLDRIWEFMNHNGFNQ